MVAPNVWIGCDGGKRVGLGVIVAKGWGWVWWWLNYGLGVMEAKIWVGCGGG